jgi:hypothetical protein
VKAGATATVVTSSSRRLAAAVEAVEVWMRSKLSSSLDALDAASGGTAPGVSS